MLLVLLFTLAVGCILVMLRIVSLLHRPRPPSRSIEDPTHLLIVLGSGGHTAEMLAILRNLDPEKITKRTYIVSSGDHFSAELAQSFEDDLASRALPNARPKMRSRILTVPRARKIHQSIVTTPLSSAWCFVFCVKAIVLPWDRPAGDESHAWRPNLPSQTPDIILTNGPATGVIVVLASLVLRFVGLGGSKHGMRSIYVESWARVKRLSLSGRILLRLVDRFIVQWDSLKIATGAKAENLGCLVGG